jgi:hypothetical protein
LSAPGGLGGGAGPVAKPTTRKKPVSLDPLSFKEAVSCLLRVAPPKDARAGDDDAAGEQPGAPPGD